MDNKELQRLLDSLDEGPLGKPEVYWDRRHNLQLAQQIRNNVSYEQRRAWAPNTGKSLNDNMKNKISESMRISAELRGHLKPVASYKDGILFKTWDCIKDAAKELGCSPSSIRGCVRGSQKTSQGMTWKYIKNE